MVGKHTNTNGLDQLPLMLTNLDIEGKNTNLDKYKMRNAQSFDRSLIVANRRMRAKIIHSEMEVALHPKLKKKIGGHMQGTP